MEAADGQLCVPEEFAYTVNEKELKEQLVDSSVVLMQNLIASRDGKQERFKPFVCAIRLGSGFGKTHILLKAPTLLRAKSVYITYNQDQSL
eukprot:scaffold454022_cov145-Attheya_sp.AAC.1